MVVLIFRHTDSSFPCRVLVRRYAYDFHPESRWGTDGDFYWPQVAAVLSKVFPNDTGINELSLLGSKSGDKDDSLAFSLAVESKRISDGGPLHVVKRPC